MPASTRGKIEEMDSMQTMHGGGGPGTHAIPAADSYATREATMETTVDPRDRDRWRSVQGQRFNSSGTRKALSYALNLSQAQVCRIAKGEHRISYAHLYRMAQDPKVNPYTEPGGALAVIAAGRSAGMDDVDLIEVLRQGLHDETHRQGIGDIEECHALEALQALVFHGLDGLSLPVRREIAKRLDTLESAFLDHADELLNAAGSARVLRERLEGE